MKGLTKRQGEATASMQQSAVGTQAIDSYPVNNNVHILLPL